MRHAVQSEEGNGIKSREGCRRIRLEVGQGAVVPRLNLHSAGRPRELERNKQCASGRGGCVRSRASTDRRPV